MEVGLEDLPAPPPEILFDQSEALPPPPPGGAADEAHLMSRMAGTTGATDWREEWNPRLSVSLATTKGLLNEPGDNNCFMNSAVQVGCVCLLVGLRLIDWANRGDFSGSFMLCDGNRDSA